ITRDGRLKVNRKQKNDLHVITSMCCIVFSLLVFGCQKKEAYRIFETPYRVIDQQGNNREYKLYLPAVQKRSDIPLLVYFHGVRSECFKKYPGLKNYTGSPVEETGLIEFSKLNKIALLVPEARYEYKFHNCMCKGWSPLNLEIDGIEKIIDVIIEKYPISKKKIFLAGLSAGAVLSFHLANRRPGLYNSILAHSQGSIYDDLRYLKPRVMGPKFGVLIGYTKGDYKNLIKICLETEKIYKAHNYKVVLLKDLPPKRHRWSEKSNDIFWSYLNNLGQYTGNLE
ncbi:MAG TPA: alpha/beta hydrolase-fold protein, partial [Desulfobacterales bacterium]|nr:alpha/beta hydrolase-fold protein [Desulfobacterales bacterium]